MRGGETYESGGGDDKLEVAARGHHLLENTEEHVRVKGTLVRFVHHHGRVLVQIAGVQGLSQEHAVRHVLDHCVVDRALARKGLRSSPRN